MYNRSPSLVCVAKLLPTAFYVAVVMSINPNNSNLYLCEKPLATTYIFRLSQIHQCHLEMLQNRFLEYLLKSFLFSFFLFFFHFFFLFIYPENLSGYILGIFTTIMHATKELLQEHMCKIKERNNKPHRK